MANLMAEIPQEPSSCAVPDAADDHLSCTPSLATEAARFSLAGHNLVVVHDSPLACEDGVGSGSLFACPPLRIAGCICIGGDTYTIFSLNSEKPEDPEAPPRPRPVDVLTHRELQIATLVMQGRVNKQIAYRLHIAPNTVQSHLKRIFCKLGVNSRAAMVARLAGCFQLGTRRQP